MRTVAVRRESGTQIEVGPAASDQVEDDGCENAADHLRTDVGGEFAGWETTSDGEADGDRGVDVSAGNVTDGVGHGQQRQTKHQADAQESDAQIGKGRGQHSASTTSENKPERTDKLCQCSLLKRHMTSNTRVSLQYW